MAVPTSICKLFIISSKFASPLTFPFLMYTTKYFASFPVVIDIEVPLLLLSALYTVTFAVGIVVV